MLHHRDDRVIELIVIDVQEYSFRPHLEFVAGTQQLRNIHFLHISLQMIHETLRMVLRVDDTQLCV